MRFQTIIFNSEKHAIVHMTEKAEFKTVGQQMESLGSQILHSLTLVIVQSNALSLYMLKLRARAWEVTKLELELGHLDGRPVLPLLPSLCQSSIPNSASLIWVIMSPVVNSETVHSLLLHSLVFSYMRFSFLYIQKPQQFNSVSSIFITRR